jgi:hypothetical protein
MFIIVFERYHHVSLCCATSISSPSPLSYFLKFNFNIIIPCTPTSSKQSCLLVFPHLNPVFTSPVPLYAACLFHLILLDLFTKWYLGSAYHEGPHHALSSSPVTLTLSGPSIFLSTLFSKTLSLCCCLTKFYTHIKQNSSVYFNVRIFDKHKSFWTEWEQAFPKFNLLLICDFCSQLF